MQKDSVLPALFRGVHMSFRADKIYALRADSVRKNYPCNQQVVDL
jgi:hypothetical protein